MRHLAGILFRSIVLLLSLLLCAAAVVLWVRSYSGSEYIERIKPQASTNDAMPQSRSHSITWTRGSIRLAKVEHTYYPKNLIGSSEDVDPPAVWGYGRLGEGHVGWEDLPVRSFWNR